MNNEDISKSELMNQLNKTNYIILLHMGHINPEALNPYVK